MGTDLAAEYGLSAEEEEWRRHAATFAATRVAPLSREMDRSGRMPLDLVRGLGMEGLIGATVARAHGGGGASSLAGCAIAEEIGAVDGSVRGFLAVQAGLVIHALARYGTAEQRSAWLPGLVSGNAIGCYALTEPGAGSDVAAIATRVREEGDEARIDGEKVWITNGGIADVALVFASADPAARGRGLACHLVPLDAPGVRREPMPGRSLGHRASDHARLVFQGVRVPRKSRLGGPRQGFEIAMTALDAGRLNVAAGAVGILRACRDASAAFARERRQFGHRIGDFQQVGAALAEMEVDLRAARLLVHHAARLSDRGADPRAAVSAAKLFATEAALRGATSAVQIHASRGYTDDLPLERHYRDAVALTIYEGTSNIQRLILARTLLGKDDGGNDE